MAQEIERKFLLTGLPPGAERAPVMHLEQGYLALEPGGYEVRLRRSEDMCWLTVKGGGDLSRREYETAISLEQFQRLWPATEGRRLRKNRYLLKYRDLTVEVDEYTEPFHGLMVAEVEFPSLAAARAFSPPPWMGRELTHLGVLKNRELLQFRSAGEVRQWLDSRLL